jgi:hypothetical protein
VNNAVAWPERGAFGEIPPKAALHGLTRTMSRELALGGFDAAQAARRICAICRKVMVGPSAKVRHRLPAASGTASKA